MIQTILWQLRIQSPNATHCWWADRQQHGVIKIIVPVCTLSKASHWYSLMWALEPQQPCSKLLPVSFHRSGKADGPRGRDRPRFTELINDTDRTSSRDSFPWHSDWRWSVAGTSLTPFSWPLSCLEALLPACSASQSSLIQRSTAKPPMPEVLSVWPLPPPRFC